MFTSRGPLIVRTISWAVDFKDSFVFRLENCVLIPHIGSATFQTRTRMATLTAENLIAAISGQNMPAELK